MDSNERLSGEMIHTTSLNEAEFANGDPITMEHSHGCIHIRPQDRNVLQGLGLFKNGTVFKVHSYKDRLK